MALTIPLHILYRQYNLRNNPTALQIVLFHQIVLNNISIKSISQFHFCVMANEKFCFQFFGIFREQNFPQKLE